MVVHNDAIVQRCLLCNVIHELDDDVHILWTNKAMSIENEQFKHYMNADMFKDPTIPSMKCKCPNCDAIRDVKYVKVSPNLQFLYRCITCEKSWTSSARRTKSI